MTYATLARFGDYNPADFGWGSRDPMRDDSLLVSFEHSGARFGLMHRDVVPVFRALLDELVPHIPGGLTVHNDEGCYNPSSVTVGGDRSFHTYAIAIDVNWSDNPMYAPNEPTGPNALPPITSQIARKYGCEWGGDWTYPQDWMHLECHLTPQQARAVRPLTPTGIKPAEQEDDMGAPITATRTTDSKGNHRYFITGPKGVREVTSRVGASAKTQFAGVVAVLGLKIEDVPLAQMSAGRSAIQAVLG